MGRGDVADHVVVVGISHTGGKVQDQVADDMGDRGMRVDALFDVIESGEVTLQSITEDP